MFYYSSIHHASALASESVFALAPDKLFRQLPTHFLLALQIDTGGSFALALLQTLVVLAFVCGLAYVVLRVALPRLGVSRSPKGMMRVVDSVSLEPRRNLYVVEVAGRWMLVASSEAGVQMISELNERAAQEAEAAASNERLARHHDAAASIVRGALADGVARFFKKR